MNQPMPQQQAPQGQGQQMDPNAANSQGVPGPEVGSITGDPTLDQALAETMSALPRGSDQIMSNLLMALQPYLVAPGTQQPQGNPMQQAPGV